MAIFADILRPTLIVDTQKVSDNIGWMAAKAAKQGIHFRPHFKTHQSVVIGEIFRKVGVKAITVSSVEMAEYFASHGWQDIMIAFPVNLRQAAQINQLAGRVHLGVIVESHESIHLLDEKLNNPVDAWIKIDTGTGRTGIAWDRFEDVRSIVSSVSQSQHLNLRGLLTHAGWTYSSGSKEEVCQRYQLANDRLIQMRTQLSGAGFPRIELSVGDTPGCVLCDTLGDVNEIRPGNFVFFDAQMLRLGVCTAEQVAAAVACPVVSMHPERDEAVIYGGAVHFSKDTVEIDGERVYGLVVRLEEGSWSGPIDGAILARVSQEHGVLRLTSDLMESIKVGDIIGVIPAHVCLTVSALRSYTTLQGDKITTFES